MPNPQKTKSREQLEKSWARKNNAIAMKEAAVGITTTLVVVAAAYPTLREGFNAFRADVKLKRSMRRERRETVHNVTNLR